MTQPIAALHAIAGGRRHWLRTTPDPRESKPIICPDCPTLRHPMLQMLLVAGPDGRCALPCVALRARDALPASWAQEHSMAIVRRGVVVRQRMDARGRKTAVEAAGSGCMLPLATLGSPDGAQLPVLDATLGQRTEAPLGYAASDTRVCLVPRALVPTMLGREDAARAFAWLTSHTLLRVERMAQARARTKADARLGAVLLALSETLSPLRVRDTIPSELLQRDLGALAALRTESVCRSLQSLAERGAIERTEEGTRIADRAMLASM